MNLVTLFNFGHAGRWDSACQSLEWQVGCAGSVISARGTALVPPGRSQRSDASGGIRRKGEPVLAEKVFIIINKGWHTLFLYIFVLLYLPKECVSFQISLSRCQERGHKVFMYHLVISSGPLSPEFIALALSCCPLLRLCSALGAGLCVHLRVWGSYCSFLQSTSERFCSQKVASAVGQASSEQCLPFSRGAGETIDLCELSCEIWILKTGRKGFFLMK